MTMTDAVPTPIRELASLFGDALTGVKFPDVDGDTLTTAVARVDELAQNVARLEDQLAQARAALDGGTAELGRLATRAHAYARVFADDNDELRTRIDAITLPRARATRSASASASSSSSSSASSPSSSAASSSSSSSSASAPSTPGAAPSDEPAAAPSSPRRRRRNGATNDDDGQQLFAGAPAAES
jgi:hypothetical protein